MDEFSVDAVWKEVERNVASSTSDARQLSVEQVKDSLSKVLTASLTSDTPLQRDHLFVYDTLDSSNTECKRRIESAGALRDEYGALTKDGERLHKTVVATAEQTAGRGRLGRQFYSPSQTGIYFSIIYVPEGGVTDPALFTVTAAVGVCRAIGKLYGKEPQIKWVNDIYLNGKKVCGILTEGVARSVASKECCCTESGANASVAQGGVASKAAASVNNGTVMKVEAAIIGIGINIAVNKEMPAELAEKAGGIVTVNTTVTRAQLLAAVITEVLQSLDTKEDIIPEYRNRSMLKGKKLTVTSLIGDNTTNYEATALDITEDAGLLVQLEDGSRKVLHSGEVSLHYTGL